MVKFIFDLDGTLTKYETLPFIAEHFLLDEQIAELTMQTVKGNIPFDRSLMKRVAILGKFSVSEVSALLERVDLHEKIHAFIQSHMEHSVIATSNLSCWVDALLQKIGCKAYCSEAYVEEDRVKNITSILCKEAVVDYYRKQGDFIVFVGDGENDAEAMRLADVSIATALIHVPAKNVLAAADHIVHSEEALRSLLEHFLSYG